MTVSKQLSDTEKARFFDVISQSVDVGFSIMDEDLNYLFINENVYEHLNIEPDDLKVGGSLIECYKMMLAKGVFEEEHTVARMARDAKTMSEETSVDSSTTVLKLANGKTQELKRRKHKSGLTVSMSHDISELIEKDQLFEEALTLGQAGYWMYDLVTKETQLSHSIQSYFEQPTIDKILKHGILAGVHPEHKLQFQAAIKMQLKQMISLR